MENIFVEINLRSKKWLISGSYNPNTGLIENRTVNLSKNLDFYSSKYENVIVIGDFNSEKANIYFEEFKNLIKQPTCVKSLENPTSINHILTNHPKTFHASSVF